MTAIQRFAIHGTIMNPHSSGPYVRHEDHLAAMQGRCLAQIEEPAGAAPAAVAPQGDYPEINSDDFAAGSPLWDVLGHWAESGDNALEMAALVDGQIQKMMRAYVDADRAARAEQSAAVAGPTISDEDRMTLAGALGLLRGHRYDGSADALQRVLDANAAAPAPSGWRLVPAVPTRGWIAAVADDGYFDVDCAQMIANILSHAPAAPALEAPAHQCCNSWFLSLPEGRQAVLRENQWMLADAAYQAGRESSRALEAPAALLTKPALVGGGRFGVGVPERYVIEAAQRHHEQEGQREAMTAEQFADEERKRRTLWELIHGPLAAAPQAPNCTRCSGSGEDPDGYLTHGHGPDDHTVDGPCRECDGSGAAPQAPAAPAVDALSQAVRDVLAERQRQVEAEGYDTEHDDAHVMGEIGALAALYLMPDGARDWDATSTTYGATLGQALLPEDWTMPTMGEDRHRDVVKGIACGLAELERLYRAAAQAKEGGES